MLIALAAALAPLIPLPIVTGRLVADARARWLLGVLTVGIVWLAPRELWLALIGLWYLIRWPAEGNEGKWLGSLLQWIAVGVTWALLLQIPAAAWPWLPWAWLAVAGWQVWQTAASRWRWGGRQKGSLGSPVITSLYLALVAAFCPWWGWPVLALGLALVSSMLAFVAVGAALVWLWPGLWLAGAAGGLAVALLWCWSPVVAGQRLLEWTPRGDTVDSVISRARGWQLIIHHGRARWLLGHGPMTMEPSLLKWGSRYDLELCWGEAFNEPLQVFYEYGVLGLAAVAAFCWRVVPHLTLGDPWSAAWVAGGVLAMGHWPLRHPSIALPWIAISARLVQ